MASFPFPPSQAATACPPALYGNTQWTPLETVIAGSLTLDEYAQKRCVTVDVSAVFTSTDSYGVTRPVSGQSVHHTLADSQTKSCLNSELQEKEFILEKVISGLTGTTTMQFRVEKPDQLNQLAAAVVNQTLAKPILECMIPGDNRFFFALNLKLDPIDIQKGLGSLLKIQRDISESHYAYLQRQNGVGLGSIVQPAIIPYSPGQQNLSMITQTTAYPLAPYGNTQWTPSEVVIAGSLALDQYRQEQCMTIGVTAALNFTNSYGVTTPVIWQNVHRELENSHTRDSLKSKLQEEEFILEKIISGPPGAMTMEFRVGKPDQLNHLATAVENQTLAKLILECMIPENNRIFFTLTLKLDPIDFQKGLDSLLENQREISLSYYAYLKRQNRAVPDAIAQSGVIPYIPGQQNFNTIQGAAPMQPSMWNQAVPFQGPFYTPMPFY